MKKKIIGILSCMLLIATAVPAVSSLNNRTTPKMASHSSQTDNWKNFLEVTEIIASDKAVNDEFGYSVSLFGNTALVGAPMHNGTGSAYVFTRVGHTWTQTQELQASDGADGDLFGWSVSLHGGIALIGAPIHNGTGSAYIFTYGTTWTQTQELTALNQAIGDHFGISVFLSGTTALIGAPWHNGTGAAYVFTYDTTWTQTQELDALVPGIGEEFGMSVSLSGNKALIGAPYDNSSGEAYVFKHSAIWEQEQELYADDHAPGDLFGWSVSLDGKTALIGAWGKDSQNGSAYVFIYSSSWALQKELTISDPRPNNFGGSVSLSGDTALISAAFNHGSTGAAYLFDRADGTWPQMQKITTKEGEYGDNFGVNLYLNAGNAIIGAAFDDEDGLVNAGSAYVFSSSPYYTTLSGGFGISMTVTNYALENASNVAWQIHAQGGLFGLVNTNKNGTITAIASGATSTPVSTGIFLGLGPIAITASAGDEEVNATGIILLVYVIGIK